MSWKCLIEGILSRMGQLAIFFLPAAKSDLPPQPVGRPVLVRASQLSWACVPFGLLKGLAALC